MKYYNVTFKWYDTDTYCSNIAKAECAEDVKAHYTKYDSNPTITEASSYEVEAAKERGKPIVTCPQIEAPAEIEAEAAPEQTATDGTEAEQTAEPFTITENAEFGSVEVKFDGKPSEAVRDSLKALRFRWHRQRGIWYGYADPDTVRAAIKGEAVTEATTPTKATRATAPAAKVDREALRREFCKAWDSPPHD